ncbi:unnamed protein product, partial [Mesorhabditis spiculigera]
MGIGGLLPFVKPACKEGHISEIAGKSVAIDASCLLHRGLFGCMDKVATGVDTNFFIYYVRGFIEELLKQKCHVVMVFDGRRLPAKREVNDQRREQRERYLAQGHALMKEGKQDEASENFKRATHITKEMVDDCIRSFRKMRNVDVVVSPYESDAQLAFLSLEGIVDYVITQDSDLIVFGCHKIIFKWTHAAAGSCVFYDRSKLENCFQTNFKFTFEKFRRLCILSGCDYLQAGLPGVGLSKAQVCLAKTGNAELRQMLRRVPFTLRMPKLRVTNEFIEDFIQAENTFLHQVVFDPRARKQRPLTPYPESEKENIDPLTGRLPSFEYAGVILPPEFATQLALGNSQRDDGSFEENFELTAKIPAWSIWSPEYEAQAQLFDDGISLEKSVHEPSTPGSSKHALNVSVTSSESCSTSVIRVATKRVAQRVKNEPPGDWCVQDMLRMYSQPARINSGSPSSSQSPGAAFFSQPTASPNLLANRKRAAQFYGTGDVGEPSVETLGDSSDDDVIVETTTVASSASMIAREKITINPFKRVKRRHAPLSPSSETFDKPTISPEVDKELRPTLNVSTKSQPSTPALERKDALMKIQAFGFRSSGLTRTRSVKK